MFDFANEMSFDEQAWSNKSTEEKSLKRLLQSPAILAGSLKKKYSATPKTQNQNESKTNFLSSNCNELCHRIKLLLPEKQAGKKSHIITEELVAISDKLLEHKCIDFELLKVSLKWSVWS